MKTLSYIYTVLTQIYYNRSNDNFYLICYKTLNAIPYYKVTRPHHRALTPLTTHSPIQLFWHSPVSYPHEKYTQIKALERLTFLNGFKDGGS